MPLENSRRQPVRHGNLPSTLFSKIGTHPMLLRVVREHILFYRKQTYHFIQEVVPMGFRYVPSSTLLLWLSVTPLACLFELFYAL
jgi:hypothetical protein